MMNLASSSVTEILPKVCSKKNYMKCLFIEFGDKPFEPKIVIKQNLTKGKHHDVMELPGS